MIYPQYCEIQYQDPLKIFKIFAEQKGAVFLDSARLMTGCGRYSFIAVDPFLILKSKNSEIYLNEKKLTADPFEILAAQLKYYKISNHCNLPPFQGGIAGLFSYDLYQHLEKINSTQIDDMQFPDMVLGFYDVVIAFDHELKRAWIFSSGFPVQEQEAREIRARKRLECLQEKLKAIPNVDSDIKPFCEKKAIQTNFTAIQYQEAVKKVKGYILAGDIFEANISQRFHVVLNDFSSFELYQRLRKINPAPFSAFLNFQENIIASASPERFLKLINNDVETRPIKGTRARGKTPEEDKQFSTELLNSEKDHAENVMIVDLMRNDLSRVCEDFSVNVPQLCGLESYATVHHLVSVVTGKLKKEYNAVDLLRVAFPGGSITGAPKIRAMEIIAEIEPTKRGPYCGSVGYIGFNGDMDTSILIRTFVIKNNKVSFQTGGAVVLDSDPKTEYDETITKARALLAALTE